MTVGGSQLGQLLELEVGAVAHGGHCVARIADEPTGRVVFVRHALPGERVRVRVTEDAGGSFCRADAVEILRPSAERVVPPCPHAAPGRCGGCDWQHAGARAQRELKAHVVRDQFARLAGLDVAVEVEQLPGGLLGWRTRILYASTADGQLGLRQHRSHQVEVIDSCPLGVAAVGEHPVLSRAWPGESGIEVATGTAGATSVLAHRRVGRPPLGATRSGARRRRPAEQVRLIEGPEKLHHQVAGIDFDVQADGFWQVHPAAAATFGDAVLQALGPQPGETALDLYAGAGLFTALLARAVGPGGRVVGVESSGRAVADAMANLGAQSSRSWAEVRHGLVDAALIQGLDLAPDLVVLDPPRAGAGAAVISAVLALTPRAVAYVACDPASLARDVRYAIDRGWRLAGLRAFDAFPMTHHVECVALLNAG